MARPALRIGIRLPQSEPGLDWSKFAAMAQAAEESGFDSVWLGDDLASHEDERSWDNWTLLATIANATQRVAIGPLVVSAAFHPPAFIAKMAVAVQSKREKRQL